MSTSDTMKVQLFPPLKNHFFSILFHENFNYRVLLLLRRHERSECHFCFWSCFWGLGLAPTRHRLGILHGIEKVPFVYPCSMLFKICFFLPFLRHLLKIAPDVTKWSQKRLSFSENQGQFSWKIDLLRFLNAFECF